MYALDGGVGAWTASERALESGLERAEPALLAEARESVQLVEPEEAFDPLYAMVIHVGTSQEFADGHPPGARWAARGTLERDIEQLSPERATQIVTICEDGSQSLLAAQTLLGQGRANVSAVAGGMVEYRQVRLPLEVGLTGVMSPPSDILTFGPQRGYADMQHYLRWETALGEKYHTEAEG